MAFRVFVDGQEGTTGLRIHEYLAARADVEVLRIDPHRRKDSAERARLLRYAAVHLQPATTERYTGCPTVQVQRSMPQDEKRR